MNQQLQSIRRYVRMVWPHRWSALGLSAVVCMGGWLFALTQPNVYQANAKIFVDTRSMLRPLLRGLAVESTSLTSSASLMKRTLLTRPNLEAVARKTDLDLKAKNDKDLDVLVTGLAQKIKLEGTTQDNIYEIIYVDSSPQQAKRVVDELLNAFLESALGSNRKDTAVTQKFLDGQISEYERRLVDAEVRLKEFKQRNVGQMPERGSDYFSKLQQAKGELANAEMTLDEARKRAETLRQQLGGEEPVLGVVTDQQSLDVQVTTQYDGRIAQLHELIDKLLLQYTEKHPDIVAAKQQLENFEHLRDEELKRLAVQQEQQKGSAGLSNLPTTQNGMYQEIRIQLAEADAEVAGLTSRVESHRKIVQSLERSVTLVPEVEAELKRLNRDYDLNHRQYLELMQRRESARMSQEVDQQGDDIKLKIIEPPRVPTIPTGPKRIQLMSMVMIAGLGAGVAMAILLSLLNPRIYSAEELKEFAQLPVIGAVSLVFSERQRAERRMEMAVFAALLFGLISIYGGLVILELNDFDLNGRITGLLEKSA